MDKNVDIPEGAIDITPEDSVVPVYQIQRTDEENELALEYLTQGVVDHSLIVQNEELKQLAKKSAIEKLAKLGLTEEEASAIAGL